MKVKGYLAYKVGKRSDGYITDILALSHPSYFNKYQKSYGLWERVLTLNNGGPDPNIDKNKRQVFLWFVRNDHFQGPGYKSLMVKKDDKKLVKLGCDLNEATGGQLLHLYGEPNDDQML